MVNQRTHQVCPKCGEEGSGIYPKMIKNWQGKSYTYDYFAHKLPGNKIKWCYVGRQEGKPLLKSMNANF